MINLSYQWYLTNQPLILEESSRSSVVSSIKSETDSLPINNGYIVLDEEPINVSIEPQEGEIPPGGEQLITFKFSPVEIIDFTHYFRCQLVEPHPLIMFIIAFYVVGYLICPLGPPSLIYV